MAPKVSSDRCRGDAQELPQQVGAVKGEFVAAAVIGKSEQFRDMLRSA